MIPRRAWCVAAVIALLATAAPGSKTETDGAASLQPEVDFALALEATLNACDSSLFNSSVDFGRLLDRGTGDLRAPASIKEQFAQGVRKGFTLGADICQAVRESGGYTLMKVRRVDGEPRALFRMLSDSGLNYHDFLLFRSDDGPVKILDFYVHTQGEWYSRTLRRGFLPLVAQLRKGSLQNVRKGENLYLDNIQNLIEMQTLYREREYGRALEIFRALPEQVRMDRNILMQRFAIAVHVGGEEYDAAMLDLKRSFPDDPGLDLVLIDHYFNKKEYGTALELVDRIDRAVGGDPYLDFVRANLMYFDGKHADAKRFARQAIQKEPGLEDPYWTLVSISLDQKDFVETARLLSEIESQLGLVVGDLREIPEYAEFLESSSYGEWIGARE